jgi:hypothetical protein
VFVLPVALGADPAAEEDEEDEEDEKEDPAPAAARAAELITFFPDFCLMTKDNGQSHAS